MIAWLCRSCGLGIVPAEGDLGPSNCGCWAGGAPTDYERIEFERSTPGITRIAVERARQIAGEGFDAAGDHERFDTNAEVTHGLSELAMAAACYAIADEHDHVDTRIISTLWPWGPGWWKPADRVRNLEKAGALIAAELDRLLSYTEAVPE